MNLMASSLVLLILGTANGLAAEGGSSNYIPGFYGDQALSVALPAGVSVRNDTLILSGNGDGSLRSGTLEVSADLNAI